MRSAPEMIKDELGLLASTRVHYLRTSHDRVGFVLIYVIPEPPSIDRNATKTDPFAQ